MSVDRTCANKECKAPFKAKEADVKRGWGKFCSKSCKARRQAARYGFNSKESYGAAIGGNHER